MIGKRINFKWLTVGFLMLVMVFAMAQEVFAVEGSLTISDRELVERLTRLEEGQKGLERGLNKRIDDLKSDLGGRIDDLRGLVLWGFGVLFAGMFTLIGFVIWDRRSALAPAIRKNKEIEERGNRMEKALKEYALKEPKLAEVLKSLGMW